MKKSITFGRYNKSSYGHINTMIAILKKYRTITIGLIIDDKKSNIYINEKLQRIYELADKNYINKELLPVKIRKKMILAGIKQFDHNLMSRVNVEMINRPEYFKTEFNDKFPKGEYDLVFPQSNSEKNEFDILRNKYMGMILEREIHFVEPELIIHNSEIKEQDNKYIPTDVLKILGDYSKNII